MDVNLVLEGTKWCVYKIIGEIKLKYSEKIYRHHRAIQLTQFLKKKNNGYIFGNCLVDVWPLLSPQGVLLVDTGSFHTKESLRTIYVLEPVRLWSEASDQNYPVMEQKPMKALIMFIYIYFFFSFFRPHED